MGFRLEREKTGSTPYVLIDEEMGYAKLAGVSFHENIIEFFREISDWFQGFLETDFDKFIFDCELEYFNSATAKLLLNIFLSMDDSSNSKNIVVNWITTGDNEIILESGEYFQEEVSRLTFNVIID